MVDVQRTCILKVVGLQMFREDDFGYVCLDVCQDGFPKVFVWDLGELFGELYNSYTPEI